MVKNDISIYRILKIYQLFFGGFPKLRSLTACGVVTFSWRQFCIKRGFRIYRDGISTAKIARPCLRRLHTFQTVLRSAVFGNHTHHKSSNLWPTNQIESNTRDGYFYKLIIVLEKFLGLIFFSRRPIYYNQEIILRGHPVRKLWDSDTNQICLKHIWKK